MGVTNFGETAAGAPVREVAISGGGLSARLIEWGCVLRDLRLDGLDRPLTLGLETMADYETRSPHFGAIAGRVANRIGGARFTLDGAVHHTTPNQDGAHTLHGGAAGFGKSLWSLADHGPDRAVFAIRHADGREGFPGAIEATCEYRLAGGAVEIELTATADRPTLCNLAQHSYFNLADAATVNDHVLTLAADRYTPVGPGLIPTGRVAPVEGPLDFTRPKPLGATPIDLNFVLAEARRPAPVFAARLAAGGVEMTVETTEPGLQIYTGDKLDLQGIGLGGRSYGPRAGVCLESQLWPDAPNQPGFPSAVLRPGETYRQATRLRFRRLDG